LILHLAAIHGPAGTLGNIAASNGKDMFHVHVSITKYIIEWCKLNPSTKAFIALSSKMYSLSSDDNVINSTTKLNPSNYYGETKAEAFELVKEAQRNGLLIYGGILFTHTSPFSKSGFLLFDIARELLSALEIQNRIINLQNAGDCIDIADARDICLAITEVLKLKSPIVTVIGSGRLIGVGDIVDIGAKILALNKLIINSSAFLEINNLIADPIEIKNTIPKWKGSRDISGTLGDVFRYLKTGVRDF